MKKTNEKLQLKKEIIAQLNDVQMNSVRGGSELAKKKQPTVGQNPARMTLGCH